MQTFLECFFGRLHFGGKLLSNQCKLLPHSTKSKLCHLYFSFAIDYKVLVAHDIIIMLKCKKSTIC
jgi:hypothetical protein